MGTNSSVKAAGFEGGLDLIQRGIFHKVGIVRLFPEAVVHLNDFDVANLEFDDALVHQLGVGFLRKGGPDKLKRAVQSKHGRRGRRRNHKPAARNTLHGILLAVLPSERYLTDVTGRLRIPCHGHLKDRRVPSAIEAVNGADGHAQEIKG
jgi:hypothetical protein